MNTTRSDNCYLGIDVGTGSARAGIFDTHGTMLSAATRAIEMWQPAPDFVEQSSDNIWRACCEAVRAALAEAGLARRKFAESALTPHVRW